MSDRVVRRVVDVILIIFLFIWFQFMKWSMGFENMVIFALAVTVSELWNPKQDKDE
jgi:hypothetical protein